MYKYCFECQNKRQKTNFCTHHVVNLYFSWNSMNNLSSYDLTSFIFRPSTVTVLFLIIISLLPFYRYTVCILVLMHQTLPTACTFSTQKSGQIPFFPKIFNFFSNQNQITNIPYFPILIYPIHCRCR